MRRYLSIYFKSMAGYMKLFFDLSCFFSEVPQKAARNYIFVFNYLLYSHIVQATKRETSWVQNKGYCIVD